jgi:endo-1,4-beta-xylanase
MSTLLPCRRLLVVAAVFGLVVACCGGTNGTRQTIPGSSRRVGPLRHAATAAGVRIGAAVDAGLLTHDKAYARAVARNFTSVTPENAMKWSVLRPAPGRWNWSDADAVVDFAERHRLEVRGHTLVWGQNGGNGLPGWLRDTTDPVAFRKAVLDGITDEVSRFRGRVNRWDVVNEPLATTGTELDPNPYLRHMGPDYLAVALKTARAADPDAELWINENLTEYLPAKGDALVELVRHLHADGVPLDGVGLQTHLVVDAPLRPGGVGDLVRRLGEQRVKVALTEVDVPGGPTRDAASQAALWSQVTRECLHAGCDEVTGWGVDDGHTWLDDPNNRAGNPALAAFPVPTRPLLLDQAYRPKPTYNAVVEALRAVVDDRVAA